jgi:hypothetical protein
MSANHTLSSPKEPRVVETVRGTAHPAPLRPTGQR